MSDTARNPLGSAAVRVLAVLTLAAGVLALGMAALGGLGLAEPQDSQGSRLRASAPFLAFEVGRTVVLAGLGVVYLADGAGLLRGRTAARRAVLAVAVAVLLLYPLAVVAELAWVLPAVPSATRYGPQNRLAEVPALDPAVGMATIALMGGGLVLAGHALVALSVLLSPVVREGWARPARADAGRAAG